MALTIHCLTFRFCSSQAEHKHLHLLPSEKKKIMFPLGLSPRYLLRGSLTLFSIPPGAPIYAINNSGRIKDSVIYSSHDSNSLFCHSQIDLKGKCWLIVTIVPTVQIQAQNPDKGFFPFVFRQDISLKLFKFSKTMNPINVQRARMSAWKGERVCVANAACRKCYYINGLCKTKTLILS